MESLYRLVWSADFNNLISYKALAVPDQLSTEHCTFKAAKDYLLLKGLAALMALVKLTKMLASRHLMLISGSRNSYHIIIVSWATFEDGFRHLII